MRGNSNAKLHSEIFSRFCKKEFNLDDVMENKIKGEDALKNTYSAKTLGGGRMKHFSEKKEIQIYGSAQVFGRADHELTAKLLAEVFPDYKITAAAKPEREIECET